MDFASNYPFQTQPGKTFGDLLTASESFRQFAKSTAAHRKFCEELPLLHVRATLTSSGLTSYERPPSVVLLEQQPLTIAQLFAQGQTTASSIRAFRETSFTNGAAAVGEEGQKPEVTFALEEVDFGVKKIAAIARVTDEMLNDHAAVRDYVNTRLAFMVQAKEDSELLNGDGASNRITGVLNTGSIQTEAASGSNSTVDAIHKAITKVRVGSFFEADAIVMHPTDWQTVRLTKDQSGQYYAGGPFGGPYGVGGYKAHGPLWGLPVVVTTAIAQGTALVGSFKLGAQLWRRLGLIVESTNSDGSDFVYNRIAIRAETRLALAVYRPPAFCTVTGIPA